MYDWKFPIRKVKRDRPNNRIEQKITFDSFPRYFFGPLHLFHMVPFKSLPVWCTLPSHHMHGLKIEHTKSLLTMSQIWSREWEIEQLQKLRWRGRCVQMFIHNICKHVFFWRMKMASRFGINCKPKFDGETVTTPWHTNTELWGWFWLRAIFVANCVPHIRYLLYQCLLKFTSFLAQHCIKMDPTTMQHKQPHSRHIASPLWSLGLGELMLVSRSNHLHLRVVTTCGLQKRCVFWQVETSWK